MRRPSVDQLRSRRNTSKDQEQWADDLLRKGSRSDDGLPLGLDDSITEHITDDGAFLDEEVQDDDEIFF